MDFHDPHRLKSSPEFDSFAARARREELFRETPLERIERWALGAAWALKPKRLGTLPALTALWLKEALARSRALPDPEQTWHDSGLCGIVHDLSVDTLVAAYRRGLFTFAHFGPLKWMSLPERCALLFNDHHVGKNVRKLERQGLYRVTFDRAFEDVIKNCAGRRDNKWHVTWITPRIMRAYAAMFDAGYVHSFEVWNKDGALVGGGYGVAIGRAFFTESQFSHEPNTSKLGFAILNRHLAEWGYALNDGKWATPTITAMGFKPIPRRPFLDLIDAAAELPGRESRWQVELTLEMPAPKGKSAAAA